MNTEKHGLQKMAPVSLSVDSEFLSEELAAALSQASSGPEPPQLSSLSEAGFPCDGADSFRLTNVCSLLMEAGFALCSSSWSDSVFSRGSEAG